jgi:thiol:disulfide interchange protein
MRSIVSTSLAFALLFTVATARAESVQVVDLRPAEGELPSLLKREAARAAKAGLRPYVETTAGWCKPCVAVKKYLGDPQMVAAFRGVLLIRLDIDQWSDTQLRGAGIRVVGVPTFYQLDAIGRPTGRTLSSSVWAEDIPVNMAPPLSRFFSAK